MSNFRLLVRTDFEAIFQNLSASELLGDGLFANFALSNPVRTSFEAQKGKGSPPRPESVQDWRNLSAHGGNRIRLFRPKSQNLSKTAYGRLGQNLRICPTRDLARPVTDPSKRGCGIRENPRRGAGKTEFESL